MFNDWKDFYDKATVLNPISDRLKLPYFEKTLLREANPDELKEYYENQYGDSQSSNSQQERAESNKRYSHLVQPNWQSSGYPPRMGIAQPPYNSNFDSGNQGYDNPNSR